MPPPDDRLKDLHRQRALVQEHLAWLDREIAAASGEAAPRPAPPAASAVEYDNEVEAVLESYRAEAHSAPAAARRGCYFVFFAALALWALAMLAWYFYTLHHRLPPVR
jgi:hypothetical protein